MEAQLDRHECAGFTPCGKDIVHQIWSYLCLLQFWVPYSTRLATPIMTL